MPDLPDAILIVEHGIDELGVFPLEQSDCILGKSTSAHFVLDNPYVSRRHAVISQRYGRFEIEDLGSKNGTLVNGERLTTGGRRLQSGDRIELGRGQVILRFQRWDSTLTLPATGEMTTKSLVVESRSREVWVRGQKLSPPLSRKEFDILSLLYLRRGEACSKDEIALQGWPERADGDVSDQDIEQYIHRLRLRLEPNPSRPRHIVTVRGFGYRLELS